MTSSDPSPEIDLSWQMREREAQLLAALMRTSRLTVLYGETGPGRTALLIDGVVPLLRRRESDAVGDTTRESRVVISFPDRRSRLGGRFSAHLAELVVLFDAWSEHPLAGLRNCILDAASMRAFADETSASSLADMLATLGKRKDLQFLIVLDRFEELIALDATVTARFVDEFCEAVNRVGLCANFLLSLSENSKPRLEGLRQRIQGFDDFSVRLLRWNSVVERAPRLPDVVSTTSLNAVPEPEVVPVLSSAALASRTAELKVPLPAAERSRSGEKAARARAKLVRVAASPHMPIETKAVYAFIESTLTETARSSRLDPWQDVLHAGPVPVTGSLQGQSVVAPAAREAQIQVASRVHTRQLAPENGEAISSAPALESTSVAGMSLQSALNWLERRIRPKP